MDYDRELWLKNLKKGDKVANKSTTGLNREECYKFLEIKNVTAKGNIRLTNNILLDSNGYYSKFENWTSITYNIEPITEEIIKFEKDRREYNNLKYEIANLCDNFRRSKYTIEELKELKRILSKDSE